MIDRGIINRVSRINEAAQREKLTPPEMVQKTKAVRFPEISETGHLRSAKIQSFNGKIIVVKLEVWSGSDWTSPGDDINVDCTDYHLGSNGLSGAVFPKYAVDEIIQVWQDEDDEWYPTVSFCDLGDGLEFSSGALKLKIDTDQLQFSSGELQTKLNECT